MKAASRLLAVALLVVGARGSCELAPSAYGPAGQWQPPFAAAGRATVAALRQLPEFSGLRPGSRADRLLAGAVAAHLPEGFAQRLLAAPAAERAELLAQAEAARQAASVDIAMQVGTRAAALAHLWQSGALTAEELARCASELRPYAAYGPIVAERLAKLQSLSLRATSERSEQRTLGLAASLMFDGGRDLDAWLSAGPVKASAARKNGGALLLKPQFECDWHLKEVGRSPSRDFRLFERAAFEARRKGLASLRDQAMRPVVLRILADIAGRLAPGSVLELPTFAPFSKQLTRLRHEGAGLLIRGLPYSETARFALRWNETMDELLRSADPSLKGRYHRDIAGPELARLIEDGRPTRAFFSFGSVDEADLRAIRPAADYLHGLLAAPAFQKTAADYDGGPLVPTKRAQVFADGYWLPRDEFTKHDGGHSAFMERRDAWLFSIAGEAPREQVKSWERTAKAFEAALGALGSSDRDLGTAASQLLFEVIHERGYQYYLPILRQQLVTSKWGDVVRKKFENRYWGDNSPLDAGQVNRLEEARVWLLARTTALLRQENMERAQALSGRPAVLKQWPSIETFRGQPTGIELRPGAPPRVSFRLADGRQETTSLYEVSLAQISPVDDSRLDSPRADLLERARKSREKGELSQVDVFKIEQVLGLMQRGGATEATITREPIERRGLVVGVDPAGDRLMLASDGALSAFPLDEISLQPRPSAEQALAEELVADRRAAQAVGAGGLPWLFLDGTPPDGPDKTVAYLGVTADPPHQTHVQMARRLLRDGADAVVVVLAVDHVSKGHLGAEEAARRVALLRRAFEGEPRVLLALSASGRYVDFSRAAAAASPSARRQIALGEDNLEVFLSGNSAEELAAFARGGTDLVVFARGDGSRAGLDQALDRHRGKVPPELAARISFVSWTPDRLSSSLLRALAADGEPVWTRWVRPAVAALAAALGLYRQPATQQQCLSIYRQSGRLIERLIAQDALRRPELWAGYGPHRRARANKPFNVLDSLEQAASSSAGSRPEGYPERVDVPDALVPWEAPFPGYSPLDYTHASVLDHDRTLTQAPAIGPSFEDPIRLDADGNPLNPRGRTGLRGRGRLWYRGPNQAADVILLRDHPATGAREVVVINRGDNGRLALPGGMVDKTDASAAATARREGMEEVGIDADFSQAPLVYAGYVDDARNTDIAWIETSAFAKLLTGAQALQEPVAGDDATPGTARWMPASEALLRLSGTHQHVLRRALRAIP